MGIESDTQKDEKNGEENTGFVARVKRLNEALSSIKLYDKIIFANNLAEMVKAGLSLSRALSVSERQTKNPKMQHVVRDLSESINRGETLSSAMAYFPNVFSEVFVAMVGAGEESGKLSESLEIVGNQMSKSYALTRKVKGAMVYPSIVISVMLVIGVLLSIYVVPALTGAFSESNVQLPFSTTLLIGISYVLANYTFLFAILVAVIIGFILWYRKTRQGKEVTSYLVLHIPYLKVITQELNSAITARTMSSLLASGVNMVEAIRITQKVVQNVHYKIALDLAIEEVKKGATLSSIFKYRDDLYPILVGAMTEVGEETGKLSGMLMNVATYYEDEVDQATKNISTIIEPMLMLFVGAGVAFFAVSIIQPLYSLGQNI